ncbi:nuclear transport factor 2 family protein [Streptomyces sp. NA04227]|uniref:nuclear transport factor 2 family protein n=1 Tax=Streptomyces sp. NA04227 TaxID=2742136 RepID=UPI001591DF34|nr:nuclear transport factor 2 family protein [Streptomyces sp. NA04227]QKW05105.1 nuclear transport factor 2 family protein [Streptomyces sp. NA04227]
MLDEAKRKELALEHCKRMTSGNVDWMLGLYTKDVRFEDPVGSVPMIGHDQLRPHFQRAAEAKTVDVAGVPVAAQDGLHVAIPVAVYMNYLPLGPTLTKHGYLDKPANPFQKRIKFDLTSIFRTGSHGLIEAVWVYWGKSDLSLLDPGEE